MTVTIFSDGPDLEVEAREGNSDWRIEFEAPEHLWIAEPMDSEEREERNEAVPVFVSRHGLKSAQRNLAALLRDTVI